MEAAPVENIEVPLPPPLPLSAELTPPEKKIEPPKERPKPKPKPKEKERNEKPPAPRTSAAPALNANPAPRIAAPSAGASSSNSMSPANWRSRLMAHLNRNKRYPADARARGEQGRPRVAFTINRSGAVLSARLVELIRQRQPRCRGGGDGAPRLPGAAAAAGDGGRDASASRCRWLFNMR